MPVHVISSGTLPCRVRRSFDSECLAQLREHIAVLDDILKPQLQGHLSPFDSALNEIGNRAVRFRPLEVIRDFCKSSKRVGPSADGSRAAAESRCGSFWSFLHRWFALGRTCLRYVRFQDAFLFDELFNKGADFVQRFS